MKWPDWRRREPQRDAAGEEQPRSRLERLLSGEITVLEYVTFVKPEPQPEDPRVLTSDQIRERRQEKVKNRKRGRAVEATKPTDDGVVEIDGHRYLARGQGRQGRTPPPPDPSAVDIADGGTFIAGGARLLNREPVPLEKWLDAKWWQRGT